MTDEEREIFESYQKELVACDEIARRMDANNPSLPGAFTGTISERINRQFKYLIDENIHKAQPDTE